MAEQNESLSREIDEELRREQIAKLWEAYGVYAIAAAAALILGVGGWKYTEYSRLTAAQALGQRYETASSLAEDGKTDDARKLFEAIAKEQPSGYQALARMRIAGDFVKAGKMDAAVEAYDALAKQSSVEPLFAGFAGLQAATLRAGTADWTEMQNRLNALALETSAWRYSARELLGIEALRLGKLDEARQTFEALLTDRQVPSGITKRAQELMAMLAAAQLASVKPAAAPAANKPAGVAPEGAKSEPAKPASGKADGAKTK